MDQLREQLRTKKVDPEKYWQDKGTFGSILGHIALALGAGGASLTGGPNYALEKVQKEIDRHVEAQKAEIDNLGGTIDQENNALAQMRTQFQSPEAAEAATRALMMESARAEVERMGAEGRSVESKAKADQILADMDAKIAQARQDAWQAEHGTMKISSAITPEHKEFRAGGGGVDLIKAFERYRKLYPDKDISFENFKDYYLKHQAPSGGGKEDKLYVPGMGHARTEGDAAELRDFEATYKDATATTDRLIGLSESFWTKMGSGDYGSDEYKQARSAYSRLKTAAAKLSSKNPSDTELAAAEAQIADPTKFFNNPKAALTEFKRSLGRMRQGNIESKIARPEHGKIETVK